MEVQLKQAEVVLKKVKVTKSILNQSIFQSFRELKENEILGWVYDGKIRLVISYNQELKTVVKSIFLKNHSIIKVTKDNLKPVLKELGYDADDFYSYSDNFFNEHELLGTYVVSVFSDVNSKKYYLNTNKEVESLVEEIEAYQSKVMFKGQVYL